MSKGKALKKQNINFIHKEQVRRNMMKSLKSPTQMGKLRLLSRNVTKEGALGGQQDNGGTGVPCTGTAKDLLTTPPPH